MRVVHAAAIAALILAVSATSAVAKGGTIGIYAVIDQVTFEPGTSPNSVRISGVFVVPLPKSSGAYRAAQRGYLYFRIPAGTEDIVRKDWTELATMAGTGRVVGFCQYWVPNPEDPPSPGHGGGNPHWALDVRVNANGDAASPEPYPLPHADGVVKAGDKDNPDFEKVALQLQRMLGR
jgi:hypothetical protein